MNTSRPGPGDIAHRAENIDPHGMRARNGRYLRYTVQGNGKFPLDMLRFNRGYPRTEADAVIAQDGSGPRAIEVLADSCTPARWESFGWKVLGVVLEGPQS